MRKYWPGFCEFAEERGLMIRDLDGNYLTIHGFGRHSFGDYGVSVLGLPEEVVAQLLGHTDKRSTRRYTHWNANHLREPARRFAAAAKGVVAVKDEEVTEFGVRKDRVGKLIKAIAGTDVFAQADKSVAAAIGVKPRTISSWRTPSDDVSPPDDKIHRLAVMCADKIGQHWRFVLAWLYGDGADELPAPAGPGKLSLVS